MTKLWPIFVVLGCALLGAVGQIFFKLGSSKISANILSWILNWKLVLGIFLYATATIAFIVALKNGELSILYPVIATSYIWVSIFSIFILGESMSLLNWLGIALIIIGVTLSVLR